MGDIYGFGTAGVWFTPPGANPTPVPLGGVEDLTIEVSEEVKKFYGGYKYPLAIARGKGQATGKGKFGRISLDLMASVLTGSTLATGTVPAVANEHVVIATNSYTAAHVTGFVDYGVWDTVAGKPLKAVASGPTTGQYSVTSAGVYTFAAADSSKTSFFCSYTYTDAANGRTLTYTNQLMGLATLYSFFGVVQSPDGTQTSWRMPAVIIPKLSFALKNDDFMGQDFDFEAQVDTSGTILYVYGQ